MRERLIIAIDGPSGVGKSTVARILAERLGFSYIESGAMYRAVALLALESKTSVDDETALATLAADAEMKFERGTSGNRLVLQTSAGSRDVTDAIRSPEVTNAASIVSTHAAVRRELVELQRELGRDGGVVMEGRDIGTKVFPNAEVKIFLDASLDIRGQRRLRDQEAKSRASSAEVLREMAERDRRDQAREQSPLVPAPDSVRIDSSHLTAEEVVDKILRMVDEKKKLRS